MKDNKETRLFNVKLDAETYEDFKILAKFIKNTSATFIVRDYIESMISENKETIDKVKSALK